MEVLKQIEEEKIEIEEYSDYIIAYKRFLKLPIEKLTDQYLFDAVRKYKQRSYGVLPAEWIG